MVGLLVALALGASPPAVAPLKLRVLLGEKPAPADVEVRLFRPSPLCGTAQYRGAPLRHPDAQGWVSFEGELPPGTSVEANHPALGRLYLSAAELKEPAKRVLRFPVGLPITGRVVDARGRPMLRARVTAISRERGPESRFRAVNDTDGSFEFSNLEAGKWALLADSFDGLWSQGVELEAGTKNVDLKLPATMWISGQVLDAHGAPVKDPWLHVQSVGLADDEYFRDPATPETVADYLKLLDPPPARKVRRAFGGDAEGRFEVGLPVNGAVELWADGPLGLSCTGTPHEVVPGSAKVELRYPMRASVSLRLTRKGTLSFVASGGNCDGRELEAEAGVHTVDDLPVAVDSVTLSEPQHVEREVKLNLKEGKTLELGTLELAPAAQLAGQVVATGGLSAGFARLQVDAGQGFNTVGFTGEDGSFRLDDLAPGSVLVRAAASDDEHFSRPQKVELRVGTPARVKLTLQR